MSYYRDLCPKRAKKIPTLLFGVGSLLLWMLIIPLLRNSSDRGMDVAEWLKHGFWVLFFIGFIIIGLGYTCEHPLGKAYVRIDDEMFALKPGWQAKERSVLWSDVRRILYIAEKYTMRTRDGGAVMLELTMLDYAVIQEVKVVVDQLAAEKGIDIIRNRVGSMHTAEHTHKRLS